MTRIENHIEKSISDFGPLSLVARCGSCGESLEGHRFPNFEKENSFKFVRTCPKCRSVFRVEGKIKKNEKGETKTRFKIWNLWSVNDGALLVEDSEVAS